MQENRPRKKGMRSRQWIFLSQVSACPRQRKKRLKKRKSQSSGAEFNFLESHFEKVSFNLLVRKLNFPYHFRSK